MVVLKSLRQSSGRVPEWLIGAVLKTVVRDERTVGSNPTSSFLSPIRGFFSGRRTHTGCLNLSGFGGFFAECEGVFFEVCGGIRKENPQTRLMQKIQDNPTSSLFKPHQGLF